MSLNYIHKNRNKCLYLVCTENLGADIRSQNFAAADDSEN